jgi:ubiquinone/menaquinone biosynthesis C-methylase UbiE
MTEAPADGPTAGAEGRADGPTIGTAFDPVAADYDSYRPAYPAELFDVITSYAGGLAGATVLDVAAGTGIATRALRDRGALVVATDLGADMLRVLCSRSADVPSVQARGEALPVRDASIDVVTCATAWHWISLKRRSIEAFRVLRPGGALALWWAFGGLDGDEQMAERERGIYQKWGVGEREPLMQPPEVADETKELPAAGFVDVEAPDIKTTRTVSVREHIGHISTHSPVLALRSDLPAFRADMFAAFDGYQAVKEQVFCHLVLARRPR